jgi:ribosomal protein S12 methylthiotransferase
MRGQHVSRTMDSLIAEASHLANRGVKELILIAQELTYYGLDLYQRRALPELLENLSHVEGIEWIRLHYAYPHKFPMDIITTMMSNPKICNYLDMPLQHISDPVLKAMRRQITSADTYALVKNIRDMHPDIRIRTTFLVGFPGETEEDHKALCRFVEEMKFDRVGVFEYSHEEDTRAHVLEDNVPIEIKRERSAEIMSIQQGISLEKNEMMIGRILKVLVDRKESGAFVGRSEYDSAEVDNEIHLDANGVRFSVGEFVLAEITGATEYDLTARVNSLA